MSSTNQDDLSQLKQQLSNIEALLHSRTDQNDTQRHAFERLYQELEQLTGVDCGLHVTGGIQLAAEIAKVKLDKTEGGGGR